VLKTSASQVPKYKVCSRVLPHKLLRSNQAVPCMTSTLLTGESYWWELREMRMAMCELRLYWRIVD